MSANEALDDDLRGLLSEATLTALNLHSQPFISPQQDTAESAHGTGASAPDYIDADAEEQLADIKQALITGDDLLLVLGEDGSGKSTLLNQLGANSGLRVQCFSVSGGERFSTHNLFAGMLEAFKQKPPEKLRDILDQLVPSLQSTVARNTLCAVILDDAHHVPPAELTQLLGSMMYINRQDESLMRVALAATPAFEDSIPDLLPEGADLPYSSLTLEGMSPERATAYLDHRLQLAGFDQEFPFTERDMASLVDHSGGRPAELNALTADVLNEKYGRLDIPVPQELMAEESVSFLNNRHSKFILGALATLLIVGGLLMFMPSDEPTPPDVNGEERIVLDEQAVVLPPQEPVQQATQQPTQPSEPQQPVIVLQDNDVAPAGTNTPAETLEDTGAEIIAETGSSAATADNTIAQPSPAATPAETQAATQAATQAETSTSEELSDEPSENTRAQVNEPSTERRESELTDQAELSEPTEQADPNTSDAPLADSAEQAAVTDADESASSLAPDRPTAVSQLQAAPSDIADLLESPSWILVQDEQQFTVQLSASRDLESVQNFLRRNPIEGPNSIFTFERNGSVWHALVHGVFPTLAEARQRVEQLPEGAQRDQPWIRSIARIKDIMRQP